jgi:hypothetical protein
MIATKTTTNGHTPISSQALVGGQVATTSSKQLARIAGVLYLLVGIFGGFAQGLSTRRCMSPAMRQLRLGT